jgi:hypothetical protein
MKEGKYMSEVVIELSGSNWREPWVRSVPVPEGADKVAEWLKQVLPEVIAHAKSGDFPQLDSYVKG